MFYCENSNDFVFKQGDKASSYFIIGNKGSQFSDKGECEIIINDEVKKRIGHGQAFGELALLYGATRSASVKCDGICSFWGIDRNTFRKAIENLVFRAYEENRKFIENVKFFSNLSIFT
jgi:cGMP-dependent protein kinase